MSENEQKKIIRKPLDGVLILYNPKYWSDAVALEYLLDLGADMQVDNEFAQECSYRVLKMLRSRFNKK